MKSSTKITRRVDSFCFFDDRCGRSLLGSSTTEYQPGINESQQMEQVMASLKQHLTRDSSSSGFSIMVDQETAPRHVPTRLFLSSMDERIVQVFRNFLKRVQASSFKSSQLLISILGKAGIQQPYIGIIHPASAYDKDKVIWSFCR
ncbi:MAG: hypothetical protein EZS28_007992 [Streblomastix strix]|uniref:Uncharacterized protein n=1 Tax=Streblomastix strix TaxID=222440 RepID=A0A5J4WP05_9EUKA|nr:MAG: hypothetical protein EZS28_007992 [Streblomastix strix]